VTPIIEEAEGFRAFINLGTWACGSGCAYCYIPTGRSIPHDWCEIEAALNCFLESSLFVPGKGGTIFTFGGHTDLFRFPALIDLLIRALPMVCRFGNPVQVSTKQLVSEGSLRAIQACTQYPTQITLFVSCASVNNAATIERAADPPTKRWGTFSNLRAAGLPCALLIKPWLGSTTRRDLVNFANIAVKFQLDGVCLGAFYATSQISQRLESLDFRTQSNSVTANHPLISEPHLTFSPPACVMSEFRALLHPIRLFQSSVCLSAAFAQVCCPLHDARSCFDP
jgi:DNA repair photolyase